MKRARATSFDLADGVMLGVVILWATNSVLTKVALDRGLEPLIYVPVRFAIGTLAVFAWLKLRRVSVRVRRQDGPRLFVSGLSGFAIYNLLYVVGLSHTSVFSAAILVSLAPIFMLLISVAFGLEHVRPLQWLGVALSFVGVAIFIGDKLLAGEPALGDVLNVLAAISFAIYGLTTRNLVLRYGAPVTTAWSVLIGLIAVVPATTGTLRSEDWAGIDGISWFAMFYAAVISMMVGYALWGWALARGRGTLGAVSFPDSGFHRDSLGRLPGRSPRLRSGDRRRGGAGGCSHRTQICPPGRAGGDSHAGRGNRDGPHRRSEAAACAWTVEQ